MSILKQIETIAHAQQVPPAYLLKLYAMEGLVRRAATVPQAEEVVVRGSLLTRAFTQPTFRQVHDLDFMANYPLSELRALRFIQSLCESTFEDGLNIHKEQWVGEVIWQETVSPGMRFLITVELEGQKIDIQIDMGFNDPLVPPAIWWDYPSLLQIPTRIYTIRPELAMAWKVHGLFEFFELKRGQWKAKDLYDIYLIWKHQPINTTLFEQALFTAFEDRKMPLTLYNRILTDEFGRSKNSRAAWSKFLRKQNHPSEVTNHLAVLAELRELLDPIFLKGIAAGR